MAQTPAADSTASVSGRVTIDDKGAAGITVVARVTDSPWQNRTVAKAVTDEDGNYRLTRLPAGRFTIMPVAKAYVVGDSGNYKQPGQAVNVAEGESIEKIDFALVRGGVITGRITDAEGRPIIGELVNVASEDGSRGASAMYNFSQSGLQTDDRGVYRLYGLDPGKYKVSVGRAASGGEATGMGPGGSQYMLTYYPGVAEASKAEAIEINEGSEVANIDITPGKFARGYSVSGRVIDANSNQPVANAFIAYSTVSDENQALGQMNFTGSQSDANGKFHLEGLEPGHYAAFTMTIGHENTYSDPTPFYISSGDVTGIEIKVKRGATLEGVAVVENNSDPAVAALLQSISIYAYVYDVKSTSAPSFSQSKINSDGSFRFTGLSPGTARINLTGFPTPPRGLELVRTELQGLEQQNGIEVTAGARVTGVRLVFTYGTGKIRGELKTQDGDWPEDLGVSLSIQAVGGASHPYRRSVEVDARGHFLAENIPPGTYDLKAESRSETPAFEPVTRSITVSNGMEVPVTIVIDIIEGDEEPE